MTFRQVVLVVKDARRQVGPDPGFLLRAGPVPCSIRQPEDASLADLDVVSSSAEFLEADVTFARAILDRRGKRAVVASHFLILFSEVEVVNSPAVKHHLQALARESNLASVPLRWPIDLLGRRNGAVEAARQFGILGFRVVTKVGHLEFQAVEGGIPLHGRTESEAAVAGFAELELVFEDEVSVLLLTYQPSATRFAAVHHSVFDSPHSGISRWLAYVVPGTYDPAFRNAILRKKRHKIIGVGLL